MSAASSPGCCHPPVFPCLSDTRLLDFFYHFYHQGKAPIFTENLICRKNIKKKNHQVLSASLESLPSLRERNQSAASLPRIRPHGRLTAGFFFTKKGLVTAWTTSGSALRHSLPPIHGNVWLCTSNSSSDSVLLICLAHLQQNSPLKFKSIS